MELTARKKAVSPSGKPWPQG